MSIKTIIEGLAPMFKEAENKNLWFHCDIFKEPRTRL